MSTVTKQEWLRQSTHEDDRERMSDAMDGHLEEDPPKKHVAQVPRRGFRRPAETRHHGHGSDVPDYPAPLPGDQAHIVHEVTEPGPPLDVGPAKPAYSGMMAHGVEAPVHYGGRPAPKDEDRTRHEASRARDRSEDQGPAGHQSPVPVFIVDEGAGNRPLTRMATKVVTAPVSGSQPVQIAGRDLKRARLRLLNEDGTNGARVSVGPTSELGVLLPALMTSYEEFVTQDDIWLVSAADATVSVSVIIEYQVAGGA